MLLSARGAEQPEPPVTAQLSIPPAEVHVIGDATPLLWRFQNSGDEPLAFMWEGCCRLNGRLNVTSAEGDPVELIPPGQALAHMFAKAERLDPGVAGEYETRISDWVRLSRSGTYRLQGRYTGVLPTQQPQVPKGLALWRAAAETGPITFTVLSVDDYLKQRAGRAKAQGLELDLHGDDVVTPPRAVQLNLKLSNPGSQGQSVVWPDDFQFWLVDDAGQRVMNVPVYFEGTRVEWSLAAGEDLSHRIELDPTRFFEGVPFGDYRMFVDLSPRDGQALRVPSNPLPLHWRLEDGVVRSLVEQAAAGSKLGFRNAPLKLLRVYLGEIGGALEKAGDEAGDPKARELALELWRAGQLKPLAPRPGTVAWPLRLRTDGSWLMELAELERVATMLPEPSRLPELYGLRRHLGWTVEFTLEPEAGVTMADLFLAAGEVHSVQGAAGAWVRAGTYGAITNRLGGLTLRGSTVQASGLLKLGRDAALEGYMSGQKPGRSADGSGSTEGIEIRDDSELEAWLAELATGSTLQIEVDDSMTWGALTNRIGPVLRRTDPTVLSPAR
jgi:hypothetical protein